MKFFSHEDVKMCRERLLEMVDDKRYVHSVSVGDMLMELMPRLDGNTAMVLGLSHDYTHKFTAERNLRIIDENSLPLYEGERELAPCLHAITGSWYFEKFFPQADGMFVYALRHHTILVHGADELTLNLYVADKIERTREYMDDSMRNAILAEGRAEIRALMVMEDQQRFLATKGQNLLRPTLDYISEIKSGL